MTTVAVNQVVPATAERRLLDAWMRATDAPPTAMPTLLAPPEDPRATPAANVFTVPDFPVDGQARGGRKGRPKLDIEYATVEVPMEDGVKPSVRLHEHGFATGAHIRRSRPIRHPTRGQAALLAHQIQDVRTPVHVAGEERFPVGPHLMPNVGRRHPLDHYDLTDHPLQEIDTDTYADRQRREWRLTWRPAYKFDPKRTPGYMREYHPKGVVNQFHDDSADIAGMRHPDEVVLTRKVGIQFARPPPQAHSLHKWGQQRRRWTPPQYTAGDDEDADAPFTPLGAVAAASRWADIDDADDSSISAAVKCAQRAVPTYARVQSVDDDDREGYLPARRSRFVKQRIPDEIRRRRHIPEQHSLDITLQHGAPTMLREQRLKRVPHQPNHVHDPHTANHHVEKHGDRLSVLSKRAMLVADAGRPVSTRTPFSENDSISARTTGQLGVMSTRTGILGQKVQARSTGDDGGDQMYTLHRRQLLRESRPVAYARASGEGGHGARDGPGFGAPRPMRPSGSHVARAQLLRTHRYWGVSLSE